MEQENAKLRRIILSEHDALRSRLAELEPLLATVGQAEVRRLAHAKVQELLTAFLAHLEHEERDLRPVLERIDAWGPARVATMNAEHATQRHTITRLAGLNPSLDPSAWATEVQQFIGELRVDMAAEEKASLAATVLRDDVIAVDGTSE